MNETVSYHRGVTSSFVPFHAPPVVPTWLQLPGMIDQHGARRQLSKRLIGQIKGEVTKFSHKCRNSPLARTRNMGVDLSGFCRILLISTGHGKER
jgi:hypothetical protein